MKRLVIGFDGKPHGHLFVKDGKVCGDGPNKDALKHHLEAALHVLVHSGDESKLTPEGVLAHMAESLQGRTHAHWEDDEPQPVGRVEKSFDPDEKRDDSGKWAAGSSESFSQSKVTDDDGELLTVYHGSPKSIDKFAVQKEQRAGDPMSRIGVMFTADPSIAKRYGQVIHSAHLDIKKPLRLSVSDIMEWDDDSGGIRYTVTPDELREWIVDSGADGIIFNPSTQDEDESLGLDGEWDSPQYVILSGDQARIVDRQGSGKPV